MRDSEHRHLHAVDSDISPPPSRRALITLEATKKTAHTPPTINGKPFHPMLDSPLELLFSGDPKLNSIVFEFTNGERQIFTKVTP